MGAPLGTPLEPLHAWREIFWKFGGGATAVIDAAGREERLPWAEDVCRRRRETETELTETLASLFPAHDPPTLERYRSEGRSNAEGLTTGQRQLQRRLGLV